MELTNNTNKAPSKHKTPKDISVALRAEAIRNPVFGAVATLFAMRQRARQQVTIAALSASMKKNGFLFERQDYEKVLSFLASLGLGTLYRSSKGRIRALKDVRVSLQSIGKAAHTGDVKLAPFKPQNRFTKVPQVANKPKDTVYKAKLSVLIEGTPVDFELPHIPKSELGKFIATLQRWK